MATRSRTATIEVPCPSCLDGEVAVEVVTGPLECYGEREARAESGQSIGCTDGCPLTDDQINTLCDRAIDRALRDRP